MVFKQTDTGDRTMKFIITTYATCDFQYEVEADSKGEAEDRFGHPTDIRDETIDTVNKIILPCK